MFNLLTENPMKEKEFRIWEEAFEVDASVAAGQTPNVKPTAEGLHPVVAAYVESVAQSRQVPLEYALMPAIAALSAAVGNRVKVADGGYVNNLSIQSMLVARSGENKSAPARDMIGTLQKADWKEMELWEERKIEAKLQHEASGSKAPFIAPAEPRQMILDDSTPESTLWRLSRNPQGMLQYTDELSAFISSFDRYNGTGFQGQLLSAFDGSGFKVSRRSQDTFHCREPFYSVYGTIQPEVFSRLLDKPQFRDDGFLARWLVAYTDPESTRSRIYGLNREPDQDAMAYWELLLEELRTSERSGQVIVDPDDAEAKKLLTNYWNELECKRKILANSDFESAVYAKMQKNVVKLAGLAGAVDSLAEGHDRLLMSRCHIEWACRMCDYFIGSFHRLGAFRERDKQGLTKRQVLQGLRYHFPESCENQAELGRLLGISRQAVNQMMRG